MLGKSVAAAVIAALFIVVPATAYAAPSSTASATTEADESYAPHQNTAPSLDGSAVSTECVNDVPWIQYSVELNDPDNLSASHDAVLVLSGGGNTTTIPLGTLNGSNQLSGSVLWPGASVDEQGNGTGWPGWEFVNGSWVETDGNFAWTRGPITAVIQVNPELSVPLAYPPATALCANPASDTPAPPLAVTGSNFDAAPVLLAGGGLVVLGALAMILVGRRAARRH